MVWGFWDNVGINDEVEVASNLVVGTPVFLGLGSFYSVKRSQRKYFAEKEKLLQALNETARSKWISENRSAEEFQLTSREFLALSRDVKKIETMWK